MPSPKKVLIKTSEAGDWVGLYLDGVQVHKGHSMHEGHFADILAQHFGCEVETRKYPEEVMEELGDFPDED